jgi:6-phosphogluconolactonase
VIRAVCFLIAACSGLAEARTAVYVSNAEDGTIGVYALDADKATLTPQETVAAGAMAMPMAISRDRHFLYAAIRKAPFRVVSFAIEADGGLSKRGETPLPDNMAYIATDPSGRFLFGASYFGDTVAVSPIGADGVVEPATQSLATGRNAHAILADRSGRFVYAANLGADQILQYRFDAATGALTPNDPALIKTDAGEGPRHMVFSPDARFLYVLTELKGDLLQFAIDPAKGTLSQIAAVSTIPSDSVPARIWAADLKITPDGRFLYASERTASRIALLTLDPQTGTPLLISTVPTETQPRGLGMAPSGHFLVASGEKSEQISLYRIDGRTGALSLTARAPAGRGANWVEIIDLP